MQNVPDVGASYSEKTPWRPFRTEGPFGKPATEQAGHCQPAALVCLGLSRSKRTWMTLLSLNRTVTFTQLILLKSSSFRFLRKSFQYAFFGLELHRYPIDTGPASIFHRTDTKP